MLPIVGRFALRLLPAPAVWWLLVQSGCPGRIAAVLAIVLTVGTWAILWTTVEGHERGE